MVLSTKEFWNIVPGSKERISLGRRLLVFIVLSLVITFGFFYPLDFLKVQHSEKFNVVHCQEGSGKENLFSFSKCTPNDTRRRISFDKLVKNNPAMAERVALLRDRVRNLKQILERTSDWALAMGHRANLLIFTVALFYIIFFATKKKETPRPTVPFLQHLSYYAPQALIAVSVIVAVMQSFSYHQKFAVAIVARNSAIALEGEMDTTVVMFHLQTKGNQNLTTEQWKPFDEEVIKWSKSLGTILNNFAASYGGTYSIIQVKLGG